MHYAEGRIARFDVPLIDRPRINYLKVYVDAMMYRVHHSTELHALFRIERKWQYRIRRAIRIRIEKFSYYSIMRLSLCINRLVRKERGGKFQFGLICICMHTNVHECSKFIVLADAVFNYGWRQLME